MTKLLPCPFCGNPEPSFERMGTPRQSCIVVCGNCGARHESSDEGEDSGRQWNQRATPPAPAQPADLDRQVRDISAGIGLPPADDPTVPDPFLDCECGRRWAFDTRGWRAIDAARRDGGEG